MAITKITEETALIVGQLVCAQSNSRGLITYPFALSRVDGKKLFYVRGNREIQIMRKSLVYIVDSEAEGQALADLLIQQANETSKAVAEATATIRAEMHKKFNPLIQKLLGSA